MMKNLQDLIVDTLASRRIELRNLLPRVGSFLLGIITLLANAAIGPAQVTVNVHVDANDVTAVMPDGGIGLHTSVYANNFSQPSLPGAINGGGIQMLRYPGGSYSDIYQWSVHDSAPGGYTASGSHFGNFIRILDQSASKGMVTVNYGSSHQNTMGGQPKEAAAWVAYANAAAGLFDSESDVEIGVDAEGNNWRTAGFWSRLRGSTPAEYQVWATPLGLYNSQYNFLAINRDAPVGIEYWEIGNEIGGNGYFGPQWEYDLHAPYANGDTSSNVGRVGNPLLSPTAYANNTLEYVAAMRAVDPNIKIGVGLDAPSFNNSNQQILSIVGNNVDFGIVHWYVNNGTSTNQVLNASDDLPGLFAGLRTQIDNFVGPNDFEIHMTEFGYFGTVDNPAIDGVFAANTYATALEESVKSVHWLELSKNSYVGDGAPVLGAAYHGIQVLSRVAVPGASWVDTDSSSGNVETHATLLPDGSLGLLIANLANGVTNDAIVNVDVDGLELGESATQWFYGVNQSTPLAIQVTSGLGNQFSVNVPYRSIMAMVIPAAIGLPGDYNRDDDVDAGDYTVWRDSLGQIGADLAADGTGPTGTPDGIVDGMDYDLWKNNFSNTGNAAGQGQLAVPEPVGIRLIIWLLPLVSVKHRKQTTH